MFRLRAIVVLFCVISFISDCTIQKRLYRNGFYIDRISKNKEIKQSNSSRYNEISFNPIPILALKNEKLSTEYVQLISVSNIRVQNIIVHKKNNRIIQDSCNDKLIFRNGDIIKVRVIEVSEESVKYKRCDMLDGPIYSVGINKIYAIEYRNGYKEYFENKKIQEKIVRSDTERQFPPSLTIALIIAITGIIGYGLLLYPLIPFLTANAKKKIKEQPDKYKGWELSGCLYAGSLVIIAMFVLALLLMFAFESSAFGGLTFSYLFLFFLILLGIGLFIAAANSKRTPNKDTQL
ncbi:MAG: hypothetical protein KatS3mg027_0628 [Bacteroidia bacterium]|nr:MAG: hypothetical protein KatS3mg027_0628 [Bacteroidia bacterium]